MTQRGHVDPEGEVRPPGFGRLGARVLEVVEDVVVGAIAVFLVL